jgi:hypothetical protein
MPTASTGIRSRNWSSAAAPCGSPSALPADARIRGRTQAMVRVVRGCRGGGPGSG